MNVKLNLLGALIALSCGAANAGVIQVGGQNAGANGQITSQPGVCTVNFNAGNSNGCSGIVYSQNGGAALAASHFAQGTSANSAAPAGDTSIYLTVGPSDGTPITITLATAANYFGFFAGSLDSYNLVTFFLGNTQVDSFTGTQINTVAFPGTASNGANSAYIDYFTSSLYDRIVYASTSNAFETDNHAFGLATPRMVPEPTSTALLGLGALALVARRRRKS